MPVVELNQSEVTSVAGAADMDITSIISQVSNQQLQQTKAQVVVKFSSSVDSEPMNMLAFN